MLFLSIFMLSLACALFGVALGLVFPDMPLWLLMPMLLLVSLALAGGTGSLLYRLHRRKLSAISEDTRFKDAILRFVRESSNLKTREALYNLILETAVAAIPHATAGSLLKVIEAPSTGDEPPGENTEGENTPSENTPGESSPGESSPGESSPDENAPDGGAKRIGQLTQFEAAYGHDINILRTLSLRLEETFNYVLTKGKCDRTVVVHQYRNLNRELLAPSVYEQLEKGSSDIGDSSIMSAPVHVEGRLWGMLTIDSAAHYDFKEQHIERLDVFVGETVKIIRLFREQERNLWLMRHDPLTALLNRAHFTERFKTDLATAARGELHGTLVSMDLDCFKAINDQFGHAHGDEALRHFARHFSNHLSAQDYLSRYGGDEFVAVFLNRSTEDLQETMRDIVADLKRHPLLVGTNAVVIQFSFGMVAFHQAFHDHQQIMHASDAFMYECKREHREAYS
jgi:diguanylate cyclase (GGDEF)-like protein